MHAAPGDLRDAWRYLTAQGFLPAEAGNLTAYRCGLAPVPGGWTVQEIEQLLFARYLIECRASLGKDVTS